MAGLSAVIFVPDDTSKTGCPRPMLLQNLMGTPLLAWLVDSLSAGGVERFFLVCAQQHLALAKACFPKDAALVCPQEESQVSQQLQAFLSVADPRDQDIIVVTGPCVLLPFAAEDSSFDGAPEAANMVFIGRTALLGALRQNVSFLPFLMEYGTPYTDRDGVYNVCTMNELADWQPVLHYVNLFRRIKAGAEIWDYSTIFVDPRTRLEPGVTLMPGAILRGECRVGAGSVIGPNVLAEDAVIGKNCRIAANAVIHPGSVLEDDTDYDPARQLTQTIAELREELEQLKQSGKKDWKDKLLKK